MMRATKKRKKNARYHKRDLRPDPENISGPKPQISPTVQMREGRWRALGVSEQQRECVQLSIKLREQLRQLRSERYEQQLSPFRAAPSAPNPR
jgi:hypothetical protein